MNSELRGQLVDADGENIAIKCFLAIYCGAKIPTAKQVRDHMVASGFPYWPEWASVDESYLAKSGAQKWLRYLFSLESAAEKLVSAIPTSGHAQPVSAGMTALIADDAFAMTFQSTGQYRSALLSAAQRDSQPATIRDSGIVQLDSTLADARDAAARFAGMVLAAHRNDGHPSDVDGGELQEMALKCGLIERRTVTEPCGETCACAEVADFPSECFFNTDAGRAAIAASREAR